MLVSPVQVLASPPEAPVLEDVISYCAALKFTVVFCLSPRQLLNASPKPTDRDRPRAVLFLDYTNCKESLSPAVP